MTQKENQLEIWKPIPNYEEYEISNLGRVKRLAYNKPVCGGGMQHCDERILSPQMRKFGYQAVTLSKNSKVKSFLIHRLVATAFIPNIPGAIEDKRCYFFKPYKNRLIHNSPLNYSIEIYLTYEEACEEAIKYCLENLI